MALIFAFALLLHGLVAVTGTPVLAMMAHAICGFQEVGRAAYRGVPLIYYQWIA